MINPLLKELSNNNRIPPFDIIKKHGADSVRWYMITNSQPWENLKFDVVGIIEIKQKFMYLILELIR